MTSSPPADGYRRWKVIAALTILGAYVVQVLADIASPDYAASETLVALEFSAIIALIAKETFDIWRRP